MNYEETIKFTAKITFEQYYSEDTNFGVFGFSTEDDIPFYTQPKEVDQFGETSSALKFSKLVGSMQHLVVGGEYLVKAVYKKDKKYGDQYRTVSVYAIIPQTKESQLLFLRSIVSKPMAENLLNAYPNIVNDVANGELETIDYSLVKGVGEITWRKIKEKIVNNYLISDIITMLKPLGITFTMIRKLLNNEPNPALLKQKLNDNPYILTKINGIGFKKCDELALKLKPQLVKSIYRLVSFVQYYLRELGENDGHTWCSVQILKDAVSNNVVECLDKFEWLLENNEFLYLNKEKNRIGLKHYHNIEMEIYNKLIEKSKSHTSIMLENKDIKKAIKDAESEQGFEYVEEQLNVINATLNRTVSIITGKAGTGKTSIMRAILKAYTSNGYTVTSSALSAMAAQRIHEATNYPATTIHRTLGCVGANKFLYNQDNPILTNVMFLDEGSMVNASLFLKWLNAISDNTRIIISGDHKQLPPIGFGNVFSDLIEKLDSSVVSKLTKPMRQAEKSGILVDANIIRENKNPVKEGVKPKIVHGELQDMYYMFRNNRQSLFDIAVKTFMSSIETDGLDEVVIAVPRRKDCTNSAFEFNKVIQDKVLPNENKTISSQTTTFKLGAKVMQTVNDYDKNVFNGEIGYITDIDEICVNGKQFKHCIVTYKDSSGEVKQVDYLEKELNCLDLAYAMTVHKLQGSGRKTVIGIIDNTHYQLLDNCMLYTLLTRAKKRCLLLAEPQAFVQCIRTSHNARQTWMQLVKK